MNSPMNVPFNGTYLEISPGTPLSLVTDELVTGRILSNGWLLTGYAHIFGHSTRIQAGEYRVAMGASPLEFLQQLVSGQVILYSLTIVEGWTFGDFLNALRSHPAIVSSNTTSQAIMRELDSENVHPEGQFYPDTYSFPRGTVDIEVLRQAHSAMKEIVQSTWNRRNTTSIGSPYEMIVLASIIEKETALPGERPQIAGVFSRRLQRGMRLQTDPTVIYGLGDDYDGNLRREHLQSDTPYNSYTRLGLPPTPIALPGAAALYAAVNPDKSDALYFVATGDSSGSHYFSATLEEHNAAVARYLERLREEDSVH